MKKTTCKRGDIVLIRWFDAYSPEGTWRTPVEYYLDPEEMLIDSVGIVQSLKKSYICLVADIYANEDEKVRCSSRSAYIPKACVKSIKILKNATKTKHKAPSASRTNKKCVGAKKDNDVHE